MAKIKRWNGSSWELISGGGTTLVQHFKNTVNVLSQTNNVGIGIQNFDSVKDVLLVYQNSTFIQQGEDYNVVGNNITKISGNWSVGTVLDFVVISTANIESGVADELEMAEIGKVFKVTTDGRTNIPIGIAEYNKNTDKLSVYFNNLKLHKDAQYTINANGVSVDLVGFSANTDDEIYFEILKKVRDKYTGTIDGSSMVDGSIPMSKLSDDLKLFLYGTRDSLSAITNRMLGM